MTRRTLILLLVLTLATPFGLASAYNGHPKLVIIIIIDQFRGDYLERYRDQFGSDGFRLFLERGANFTDCNYDYANTRTAPGHATLLTGAYSNGHGIASNAWWDGKRVVTSVQSDSQQTLGAAGSKSGATPQNLLADTLGDELKLATQNKSRVFALALKDRASVLPAGFAGDAAYWIDGKSGIFVTSTYYMKELPAWVKQFNAERPQKYWNREWKVNGEVLAATAPKKLPNGEPDPKSGFYDVVGRTPFANDYEFDFARELIANENLGTGPATDLLVISLSANDILGHEVGPDDPKMAAMALALDRQLADFFKFLAERLGLANVWIALSADHGVAPSPAYAETFGAPLSGPGVDYVRLRLPAISYDPEFIRKTANTELAHKLSPGNSTEFIAALEWPIAYLSESAFKKINMSEVDAEKTVGEVMVQHWSWRRYFTRTQLERGEVPPDEMGRKYAHSYSPYGGWYVMGVPAPFTVAIGPLKQATDHSTPYTYDTHVPLAFYGVPFVPGNYRTHAEPVDLAATLSSLLGINAPTHAVGRVLTEALRDSAARENVK